MNEVIKTYITLLADKAKWEKVPLSNVCVIDPSRRELNGIDTNTEVSFGMMADLGEHKRVFTPSGTRKIGELTRGGYSYYRECDVLLAKMTPCFENGKSGIAKNLKNGIGFGSTEFYVLRAKENILPDYIYLVISSEKFLHEGKLSLVGTTGRRRLIKHYVEKFKIPLPPVRKQTQIVELCKSIETSIEQVQNHEKILKRLRKSLINSLCNRDKTFLNAFKVSEWSKTRLEDIAYWYQKDISNQNQQSEGIEYYLAADHIDPDEINISRTGSLLDGKKGPTITKHFRTGDILLSTRSVALHKAAVAPIPGVTGEKLIVIDVLERSKILKELLPYVMHSTKFWEFANITASGSVNKFSSWNKIKLYEFYLPMLNEQAIILDIFKQIEVTLSQLRIQHQNLTRLKHKILNEILE